MCNVYKWKGILVALALLGMGIAPGFGQMPDARTTTIKGVLASIKGDVYLMQDLSGRFVQFRVDKHTQRERVVVPGERIEVQLASDHRALSLKPAR